MSANIAYQLGVETKTSISFKKVNLISAQGMATAEYLQSILHLVPVLKYHDKYSFTTMWTFFDSNFGIKISFDAKANVVSFAWRYEKKYQCYSVDICPYSLPVIYRGVKGLHNIKDQKLLVRLIRKTNLFAPITKRDW